MRCILESNVKQITKAFRRIKNSIRLKDLCLLMKSSDKCWVSVRGVHH